MNLCKYATLFVCFLFTAACEIKLKEKPHTNSQSPISDKIKSKIRSQPAITGSTEIIKKVSDKA